MLIIACVVRIAMGKPVLFVQQRPGLHGEPFYLYKFRTMDNASNNTGKPLPDELRVTAFTKEGEVMGLRHKRYPLEGVQFHPESVLTKFGKRILKNFLDYGGQA